MYAGVDAFSLDDRRRPLYTTTHALLLPTNATIKRHPITRLSQHTEGSEMKTPSLHRGALFCPDTRGESSYFFPGVGLCEGGGVIFGC